MPYDPLITSFERLSLLRRKLVRSFLGSHRSIFFVCFPNSLPGDPSDCSTFETVFLTASVIIIQFVASKLSISDALVNASNAGNFLPENLHIFWIRLTQFFQTECSCFSFIITYMKSGCLSTHIGQIATDDFILLVPFNRVFPGLRLLPCYRIPEDVIR